MSRLRSSICLAALVGSLAVEARAETPPNIVLIISDDQAAGDFGFMGHPYIRTPHIDRLAGRSARYVNGYVPSSVCRPSLATLLTGLYPHQHGVHFNHPPPGFGRMRRLSEEEYYAARARADGLIRSVPTLPRVLAERGYRSFQAGKHWEGDYRLAGFTHGMTRNRPSEPPAWGNLTLQDGTVVAHGNGDAGLNIGRTTLQPIYDFVDDHLSLRTTADGRVLAAVKTNAGPDHIQLLVRATNGTWTSKVVVGEGIDATRPQVVIGAHPNITYPAPRRNNTPISYRQVRAFRLTSEYTLMRGNTLFTFTPFA
jgi:hypothetical protein